MALILKQNFQKNKVVTSKTPFYVIGPFCVGIWFDVTKCWLCFGQFLWQTEI